MELEFSGQLYEKYPNIKFMKIRPVGAELLHEDRRTEMTKLIVAFPVLQTRLKYRTAGQLTDGSMVQAHTCCMPKAALHT